MPSKNVVNDDGKEENEVDDDDDEFGLGGDNSPRRWPLLLFVSNLPPTQTEVILAPIHKRTSAMWCRDRHK